MLISSLSRILPPSLSPFNSDRSREHLPLPRTEADPSTSGSDNSAYADVEAYGRRDRNELHLSLDAHSSDSTTPLLAHRQSSHPSSSATATPTTALADGPHPGPSHILWKAPHSYPKRQSGQNSPTKSVSNMSTGVPTPTTPIWGVPPLNRSASSPSLLVSPLSSASAPQGQGAGYRPSPSLGRQSPRSLRLAVDSMYASEESDAESEQSVRNAATDHHALPKQLSPIHEQQVPFPPHRKLSTDSVPRTPDSTRTFDRLTAHSSAHNAFINRPLKRSLSQTSTSTHRSTISSAAPPVIPPLDLRPNFQSAMGVPHNPLSPPPLSIPGATFPLAPATVPIPRKSRLAAPTLPTVIGSPRQPNKVSVIYEDPGPLLLGNASTSASARTSSFMTALNTPTADSSETGQRFSLGRELARLYVDPNAVPAAAAAENSSESRRDASGDDGTHTRTDTDVDVESEHDARALRIPAGLCDDDRIGLGLTLSPVSSGDPDTRPTSRPRNPTPPSTRSGTPRLDPSVPLYPSRSHSRSHSRTHSRSRSASPTGESFLEQRWLKGMSFGADRFVLPPPASKRRRWGCLRGRGRGRKDEDGEREDEDERGRYTYAFFLFWAGFVAPWCWLVGGWLLARSGDTRAERGPVLPLWHRRGRAGTRAAAAAAALGEKGRPGAEKDGPVPAPQAQAKGATEKRAKSKSKPTSWYPLLAPSLESLAPSTTSLGSGHRLKAKRRYSSNQGGADPWIHRCRVAAAISGVLILAAFAVAMVFAAGVRP